MKALNLFPLTVFQDNISIDEKQRNLLINEITKMQSIQDDQSSYAWTGDTKGHEFLFENKLFKDLAKKISSSVIKYLQILEINTNLLDIYYQRSWATFTKSEQIEEFRT